MALEGMSVILAMGLEPIIGVAHVVLVMEVVIPIVLTVVDLDTKLVFTVVAQVILFVTTAMELDLLSALHVKVKALLQRLVMNVMEKVMFTRLVKNVMARVVY